MAASGMIAARVGASPVYNVKRPSFLAIVRKAAPTPWLYWPTWSHVMRLRTTSRGCRIAVLVAPANAAEDRTLTGPCPILSPIQPCRNQSRYNSIGCWQLMSGVRKIEEESKAFLTFQSHFVCRWGYHIGRKRQSLMVQLLKPCTALIHSAVAVHPFRCSKGRQQVCTIFALHLAVTLPCIPQKRRNLELFGGQHAAHSSRCLSTVLASLDHQ